MEQNQNQNQTKPFYINVENGERETISLKAETCITANSNNNNELTQVAYQLAKIQMTKPRYAFKTPYMTVTKQITVTLQDSSYSTFYRATVDEIYFYGQKLYLCEPSKNSTTPHPELQPQAFLDEHNAKMWAIQQAVDVYVYLTKQTETETETENQQHDN